MAVRKVDVFLQETLDVLAALAEALPAVGEPRPALLDDLVLDGNVDEVALAGHPLAVHDVELGLAEGRRHLVLHDLDAGAVADHVLAVLDGANAANVDADRRVELQRAAAGGGFGVAEHHADLLAQLVDEDQRGFRLRDGAGEFAQRLRHEARLQAHLRFAHFAFDFSAGHERRDRVDHDHIDAVRADDHLDDLERLLAVVGLRDEEVVEIDAELLGVGGVERVFGVDEGRHAAFLLGFGDDLQRQRGLAG